MEYQIELNFAKLTENEHNHQRATEGAEGFDLYSAHDYMIFPKTQEIIKTDIAIAIPNSSHAYIAPSSSLALNYSIHIMAGVLDSGKYHIPN